MTGVPYGRWLPWNAAEHGGQIDQLINIVHWFMLVLFVGWGIFFVYCLVQFRARSGHRAQYELPSGKVSKYAEIVVALFEAVLLIGFSMPVWARYKSDPPAADKRLDVHAVGEQFAWNFHYPGPDGKYGPRDPAKISASNPLGLVDDDPTAADDIVSPELHVVVNQPVYVDISSKDVIHSFAIPAMRIKQDAIPGLSVPVWFTPKQTSDAFREAMTRPYDLAGETFQRKRAALVAMKEYKDKAGAVIVPMLGALTDDAVAALKASGVSTVDAAPLKVMEVICAQLCGANHFKMKAPLCVDTEEQFEAWQKAQKADLELDL